MRLTEYDSSAMSTSMTPIRSQNPFPRIIPILVVQQWNDGRYPFDFEAF